MSAANPKERLQSVRARIAAARALRGGSAPVELIAVSKTKSADEIVPLIEAGQRVFGENRVQEAAGKWPALKAVHEGLELHLIGPLQTNKVTQALTLFDVIHTLDRPRLASALIAARDNGIALPDLFVQVNIGAEAQKAGVMPDEADAFIEQCLNEWNLPVIGLMCIPPADEVPGPYFDRLAAIASAHGLSQLSMGMSGDFEAAIAEGASHVRVGSALFGARD
ncbi:MAG: YggS family pyridoxal phosphate-dependent enzyme [Parvibaculum sp.]|nr:YggS family pyridoxal phosphate-dependent enzyme [Parvibaculum sp.]